MVAFAVFKVKERERLLQPVDASQLPGPPPSWQMPPPGPPPAPHSGGNDGMGDKRAGRGSLAFAQGTSDASLIGAGLGAAGGGSTGGDYWARQMRKSSRAILPSSAAKPAAAPARQEEEELQMHAVINPIQMSRAQTAAGRKMSARASTTGSMARKMSLVALQAEA